MIKEFPFIQKILSVIILITMFGLAGGIQPARAEGETPVSPDEVLQPLADDPSAPSSTVKLMFIHHSTGENWLNDGNGQLGLALQQNNYFVSDTNYGWGPNSIGSYTDIGNWYTWFRGSNAQTIMNTLYTEFGKHSSGYSRLSDPDPNRKNEIILFKSCFPNSNFGGNISDAIPTINNNPLKEQDASSSYHTISNAKGIYIDLLNYFSQHQDKLFVVITAPPLASSARDPSGAKARAFNDWLMDTQNGWLAGYAYKNVAVYDFYNVLTSNGGDKNTNDLNQASGNHHRWWNGALQHIKTFDYNLSKYPLDYNDSHPTRAGSLKATGEFVQVLNVFYHRWKNSNNPFPGKPILTSPANGTLFTTGSLTFRWTAGANTTNYKLVVLKADGSSVFQQTYTTSETGCSSDTSCEISTTLDLGNGTYRWYIKAINASGSTWSDSSNFLLGSILTSPNGIVASSNPTFQWTGNTKATQYKLWVGKADGTLVFSKWYTPDVAGCSSDTSCVITESTPINLSNGGYTWYIKSWDSGGSAWSAKMNFTVTAILTGPSGTITTGNPTFQWTGITTATYYKLWVGKADGTLVFSKWYTPTDAGCSSDTSCVITESTPINLGSGAYRWYIKSWDSGGSAWSAGMNFTVSY
jgi:hypothetical protein